MNIYKTNFPTEQEGFDYLVSQGVWEEVTEEGVTSMQYINGTQAVFYVNGVQINNTINTSFTMPSIEDITYDYSNELNDSVNQTKLYNTRLSNSELQALTT